MPVARPKISENPALQAGWLNYYISDRLRAGSIDIHSAFQLHHEAVRIERFSYRQPAWGHSLYIPGLYKIFMHTLTGRALGCADQVRMAEDWFTEDTPCFGTTARTPSETGWLPEERFFKTGSFCSCWPTHGEAALSGFYAGSPLDEDQAPYPFEVFPYDFATPEQELLWPGTCPEFDKNTPFDPEVEQILIELLTGAWA